MACDPCSCVNMNYTDEFTFRLSLLTVLCQLKTSVDDLEEAIGTFGEAQFDEMIKLGPGDIGAAYAQAVDLADGTRTVIFDNSTSGNVIVSMDGGTTDHFDLEPGQNLTLELYKQNLVSTADIHVKDGAPAPAGGNFKIYAYR